MGRQLVSAVRCVRYTYIRHSGTARRDDWRLSMAENGNGRFSGREVVIVEAVRTPIGRGHPEKGYYKDLHPSNLLAKTYSELISRSAIDPGEVGDVIAGCVQQWGE